MSEINGIAKEIVKTIREDKNKGTKPYDTQATVMRVEDGIAWVRIPGGVDETPAQLTMDAKEGDNVQVRVSGGRAWLAGNGTSPPTDDTKAVEANETAKSASIAARASFNAAEEAQTDAARAHDAADKAEASAGEAKTQASAANSYAIGALNSLSTTQDIIGVLNWVEESIKYVWDYPPTVEGKEYDPSKQYYTVIGKRVIDPIETDYDKYYVLNSESEPASETGNIVTFDSDLDNFPLKSLTATINPKQDLHGYDKPWSVGNGKNKFDKDNVSWTAGLRDDNGNIVTSQSHFTNAIFGIKSNTVYTISGTLTAYTGSFRIYFLKADETWIERSGQQSAAPYTFTTPNECGAIQIQVVKTITSLNDVQIEEGSTATAYEPYSNICPISGWDSVVTSVSGTNVIDDSLRGFSNEVLLRGSWYAQAFISGASVINTRLQYLNDNNAWVDIVTAPFEADGFTLTAVNGSTNPFGWMYGNGTYLIEVTKPTKFRFYTSSLNGTRRLSISPTQLDSFVEYVQGNTYTTDLPETVYGGTLDVVNGVLNIKPYYASYNGETLSGEWISDRDVYSDGRTPTIGAQVVNVGATGTNVQLTPKQVTTLLGENNVWADSGDVTVEYWDGPVGYVTPTSSFDPTETYYTVKGSPVKIDESKQDEHDKGLYYVHDLTNAKEAMADFIKARLALTDKGLYVVGGDTENEGYKILLASDGMTVYDAQGVAVSKFGENIKFSATRAQYIGNEDAFIVFNPTTAEITIGGDVLIDGTKRLSDVLTDLDVSVTQTATGADITVNGDTVSIANGQSGEQGPKGDTGETGPQGDTGPEAIVTVSVTAINYIAKTATLSATLRVDGVVTTPTSYKWTKGTSTTSLGTGATLNVTDLNAVYNCTATW